MQATVLVLSSVQRIVGASSLVELLATGVSLVMGGVLIWAGLEKLRNLEAAAQVEIQLGMPRNTALAASLILALTEIGAAVGLVWAPSSWLVGSFVGGLAVVFAMAATLALYQGKRIHCVCFGTSGTGYLGSAQLVALPIWLCGVLLLVHAAPITRTFEESATLMAVIAIAIALIRVPKARQEVVRARADRLTSVEVSRWLR